MSTWQHHITCVRFFVVQQFFRICRLTIGQRGPRSSLSCSQLTQLKNSSYDKKRMHVILASVCVYLYSFSCRVCGTLERHNRKFSFSDGNEGLLMPTLIFGVKINHVIEIDEYQFWSRDLFWRWKWVSSVSMKRHFEVHRLYYNIRSQYNYTQ